MVHESATHPYQIKIESVALTSDRFTTIYDLAPLVLEINIYENITLPYLTGDILMGDSRDLFNIINFQGTEKIKIRVRINEDDFSTAVEKDFVITNIKAMPSNDTSEIFLINIVEEHKYLDAVSSISRSFQDRPESMIYSILNGYLNVGLNTSSTAHNDYMKVLLPNASPLEICTWIKDRMVTSSGLPFFLYSTLNGKDLFLKGLDTILSDLPVNHNNEFFYNQAFTRWSMDKPAWEDARNISSYTLDNSENMIMMAKMGALNSTYEFIDVNGNTQTFKVDMADILYKLQESGLVSSKQKGEIYDRDFTLNGSNIADYSSSTISQITTSHTYDGYDNYYEGDINNQRLKIIARAIRYYLLKSPMVVSLPGYYFLGKGDDITLGRKIVMNFLKNDPNVLQDNYTTDVLDQKRSGEYIIHACRHVFAKNNYSVALSCVKLFNRGKING